LRKTCEATDFALEVPGLASEQFRSAVAIPSRASHASNLAQAKEIFLVVRLDRALGSLRAIVGAQAAIANLNTKLWTIPGPSGEQVS
jgi:hypothetical protein